MRLAAQGRVLEIIDTGEVAPMTTYHDGAAKRGLIAGMTAASRRRLMVKLARTTMEGMQAKFLTLTFAGTPNFKQAYSAMRRFLERLRRKHPECAVVWRRELQERGSIHYHLLAYNMPYYPQRQLQAVWTQCTQEARSIVDVRAVYSDKHAMSYVSKYIAKTADHAGLLSYLDSGAYSHDAPREHVGRWWGIHNEECLPYAVYDEIEIASGDDTRWVAWWMSAISYGRCASRTISRKVFIDDPYVYTSMMRQHYHYHPRAPITRNNFPRFMDGELTVLRPSKPEPASYPHHAAVGELALGDAWQQGRTRSAVLLASLTQVKNILVKEKKQGKL